MHPYTKDRLRGFISDTKLLYLIGIYIFINVVVASISGFLFFYFSEGDLNFLEAFELAFLGLFNAAPNLEITLNGVQRVLAALNACLSVILPTMFLGALVFKMLIKEDVIVFRDNCSVYYSGNKKAFVLVISFYSATKLDLLDVNIKVVYRTYGRGKFNKSITVRHNHPIHTTQFAIVETHNPFNVVVPLLSQDIDVKGKRLLSIKNHKSSKYRSTSDIVILVNGQIPSLGTSFAEVKVYKFPKNLLWGKFYTIDVLDEFGNFRPSNKNLFKNFEEIEFSFEETLPQELR